MTTALNRYASAEALARGANAPLAVCRLIFAVAEDDQENIRMIRSGAMDEETMRQRYAVILVARLHCGARLEEIGRALNLDHSAVKRAIDSIMRRWLDDPELRVLAGRITAEKAALQRATDTGRWPELPGLCKARSRRRAAA